MRKLIIIAVVSMFYLIMASCSKRQAEEIQPDIPVPGPPVSTVSYATFVAPLLQSRCAGCHGAGRSAAGIWTFNGHASVVSSAARIRSSVLVNKTMPRGGTLSAAELTSLQTWFDNGLPNN